MKRDSTGERLAGRHVVLLGIGHTNAHVLRMWGMNSFPDTDLTCISDNLIATYSGMLPAVLAGQVPKEDMEIDLVRLCSAVGARLLTNKVTGLDVSGQQVLFDDRPPVPFDVLSVGTGSVPTLNGVCVDSSSLLKIKPMQTFLQRLKAAVEKTVTKPSSVSDGAKPIRILVVGSGAAGVEIAFCLPVYLKTLTSSPILIQMVTRSDEILPGVIPPMRRRVLSELQRRSISVSTRKTVVGVSNDCVQLNDGTSFEADMVIWATGASPPDLLSKLDLPTDDRGFLATDRTLRSVSGKPIFAVGDTGTIVDEQLPKAGVYAVRQGPILWQNIQATLSGDPLVRYEPQRSFLKLLNTGDGGAIGEWKGFSFAGHWVMKLKDYIDSRFMRMYRVSDDIVDEAEPMQCKGCGCKLGGDVLSEALKVPTGGTGIFSADAKLDDAAVIDISAGQVLASTDFFTSPFDDPYLTGRVAALHSASDLIATGASVKAALANVVVPEGESASQQRGLRDLLEGARLEFSAMGASIVGGHTIVGPRWEVGFTVIGEPLSGGSLLRKEGLQAGDQLYLTKPLGIGVLLAAHMRSQCKAADYQSLIEAMLERQHMLSSVAADVGITAGTDITGFGLAGHLTEMLEASGRSATIEIESLPMLCGAAEAFGRNIESTLAPQNRHIESWIRATSEQRQKSEYKALFDPQTCGGLLLGVPSASARRFESKVVEVGISSCVRIGEVFPEADKKRLIRIV